MNEKPLWLQEPPPKLKLDRFKLDLYPFQHSGAIFLAQNKNCLLRDATGLGKCPQSLACFNALKRKNPALKAIIVCPASLTLQWKNEAEKFTDFKFVNYLGKPEERRYIFKQFYDDPTIDALVVNYELMRKEITTLNYIGSKYPYIVIYDEAQKIKNPGSQTAQAAFQLSKAAIGNKLLTATPIFNNVNDIYGLFRILNPNLFGNSFSFQNRYTITREIRTSRGNKVRLYIGPKNLDDLRMKIDTYMFGRQVHEVLDDLPPLTFKDYFVELPKRHAEMYKMIEEKQVVMFSDAEVSKVQKLAALSYLQQCADDVQMVKRDEEPSHPKMDRILEIIQEEFDDQKLIVYTKFTQSLDILKQKLEEAEIPVFHIDGRVSQTQRDVEKTNWENTKGKAVLIITSAGGAGLNLQASNTIMFLNYPWSYGEILQILGRIRRIGTKHDKLFILNVFAKGTIDEAIMKRLQSKKEVFTKVFSNPSIQLEDKAFDEEILSELNKNV